MRAEIEHDSNPLMKAAPGLPVIRQRVTTDVGFLRAVDRHTLNVQAGAVVLRSNQPDSVPDRNDPNFSVTWAMNMPTSKLTLALKADQTSARAQEFDASGYFVEDRTRTTGSVDLGWQTELSERWSASFSSFAKETRHEKRPGTISSLRDFRTSGLSSQLSWGVSEKTSAFLGINSSQMRPTDGFGISSDLRGYYVGVSQQLTPIWDISIQGGGVTVLAQQRLSAWNATVRTALQLEQGSATLEYGRLTNPSMVTGTFTTINQVKLSGQMFVNEKTQLGLDFAQQQALENEFFPESITQTSGISLVRQLSEFSSVQMRYARKQLTRQFLRAESDFLGFTFSYNHPDF